MSDENDMLPHSTTVNNVHSSAVEAETSHKIELGQDAPRIVFKTKSLNDYKNQINTNTDPNKGLYIMATFQNDYTALPLKLLLDSGSSMSLMHNEVYNRLPQNMKPPIRPTSKQIKFADGSLQNSTGLITMPLQLGDEIHLIDFVLGDYTDEGIIGINDIHAMGLTINFQKMLVHKGNLWLPIHDVRCNLIGRKVIVRKSTVIPKRSQHMISACIEGADKSYVFNDTPVMLEADQDLMNYYGVIPAKSVHQFSEPDIPVMVYNGTEEDVVISDKMVLGQFSAVEVLGELPKAKHQQAEQVRKIAPSHVDLPDHTKPLYDNSCDNLTEDQQMQLKQFLIEFEDVISKGDHDIGLTHLVEHEIDTGDAKPIKIPPRRMTPQAREATDKIVKDLLARGLISPSKSEWSAPPILTRKKDGTFRFCIDFRVTVNKVAKTDSWPLPLIEETLEHLGNARWYSCIDLANGYWQIPMAKSSMEKTAFVTRMGLYHWNVMPFGLSTAGATFQRLLENLLGDMRFTSCLIYIDDLIVYAKDFDSSLEQLKQVFLKLRSARLKVKAKKCFLFRDSVTYLGFKISSKGIEALDDKVKAINEWSQPQSRKATRSFLGVCGFYRKFIQNYSAIAKPLTELTSEHVKFQWSQKCQEAFDTLKAKLTSAPILGFPREKGRYKVQTDACDVGIGCVLSQEQDGRWVVISYGSKTLSPAEQVYCVRRKEMYAMVYFINQYRHYLANHRFLVVTDHYSLKYWQRYKDANGQLARWLAFLSSYQFDIETVPGSKNGSADGLSRRDEECVQTGKIKCLCPKFNDLEFEPPVIIESKTFAEIGVQTHLETQDSVPVSCSRLEVTEPQALFEGEESCVSCQTSVLTPCMEFERGRVISIRPLLTDIEIREDQNQDPDISPVLNFMKQSPTKPEWSQVSHLSSEAKALISEWQQLALKDDMLYHKWYGDNGQSWLQLVLPRKHRDQVLEHAHDHVTAGHVGVARTLHNIRLRYFWPHMKQYVQHWVATCDSCQARKSPNRKAKAPLQTYLLGAPWERINVDFTGEYSETDEGYRYIATFTCSYTKFTIAVPLRSMQASEVAEALLTSWIPYFGLPLELHSDKSRSFENTLIRELCKLLSITKTRTTTMNPQSNGGCERVQRSLIDMLNCVARDNPFSWCKLIWMCTLAYNNMPHESTRIAPSMMVFGRHLRVPLDLVAPVTNRDEWAERVTYNEEYVLKLQNVLHDLHSKASQNLTQASIKQAKYYNNRLVYSPYSIGDAVYYHYPVKGKHDSKDHYYPWKGPYFITSKLSECLYRVQEGPDKTPFVVHYNKLKKARLRSQPDVSWIQQLKYKTDVSSDEQTAPHADTHDDEPIPGPSNTDRPQRSVHKPDKLGDWYYY